jgi:DNA polymerase Ligase (LigD)
MPRFVILEHDHPHLHWDLMLEAGDVLRTWRLASPPCFRQAIPAAGLGDHRLLYLDYQGPLSGDRGRVHRWDAGDFYWQTNEPDRLAVQLLGERTHGVAVLTRVQGEEWSFTLS